MTSLRYGPTMIQALDKAIKDGICFHDVHIAENLVPRVRTPAGWKDLDHPPASIETIKNFMTALGNSEHSEVRKLRAGKFLEELASSPNNEFQTTFDLTGFGINSRIRTCVYLTEARSRVVMSLRLINSLSSDQADLPSNLAKYYKAPKGMLLIAGQPGSGKTTTAFAILSQIIQTMPVHIITFEDPIEQILPLGCGHASQQEIGIDCRSWEEGLKSSLRKSPDVLMIGEIRDKQTAITAHDAAQTGNFVIATVHAPTAVGCLRKMSEWAGPEIVHRILGIQAQQLIPSKDKFRYVLGCEYLDVNNNVARLATDRDWKSIEKYMSESNDCIPMVRYVSNLQKNGLIAE